MTSMLVITSITSVLNINTGVQVIPTLIVQEMQVSTHHMFNEIQVYDGRCISWSTKVIGTWALQKSKVFCNTIRAKPVFTELHHAFETTTQIGSSAKCQHNLNTP